MSRSILMILFLAVSIWPSDLDAQTGRVVHSHEAPGRFCTGLASDGRDLWVADYKADRIIKIDLQTGSAAGEIPSPGFWPMGLAFDGRCLWNADAASRKIFQVDPTDGTILKTIDCPARQPGGLAWDGETLWIGDTRERTIARIDLSDGTAVRTFPAPSRSPDGLAFDGTYLWCSDRLADEIYMVDPENGEVIIVCDSPGPYPRGLAWDGALLWNVDYQDDRVLGLTRGDEETHVLENTRRATVTLTHEVKVFGKGLLRELDVFLALPADMPQQRILSRTLNPAGYALKKDRWDQEVAVISSREVPGESLVQSVLQVEAEISDIHYFIFPDRCGTLDDIPASIRKLYTADGSKYMTSDPYIQKLAQEIVGDEANPYWIARRVFDHVRERLEYKLEGGWNAAPVVLRRRTGSCSEYTFCFIALCRAAGLPARYVGAIVVRGDDASLDDVFHRWPEVFLPNYGWVPMDPQGGDKPSPRDRAMNIGHLSNRFLITTQGGGDSEFLGWYYNHNETYVTDPQVTVNIEAFGEWEPAKEEENPGDVRDR